MSEQGGVDAILGLDHVLVGVRDLEAARRDFEALGFQATPRGRHIGWGTANYCIMFPDDYIELLGVVDPKAFTNHLDRTLAERGEGLLGVAFASADPDQCLAQLAAAGIEAEGPLDLARILELPEGDVRPAFRLLRTAPAATPELSAFVCAHLSREMVWQAPWMAHPNGAVGLVSATVAVTRLDGLAESYARLFGDHAVLESGDALTVACGPHRLTFLKVASGRTGPLAMEVRVRATDPVRAMLDGKALEVAGMERTGELSVRVRGMELGFLDSGG